MTTEDGIRALSAEHVTAGSAGEAELTWRSWACGEMADVEAIPDACPNCGAEREESYYWIED